jgi:hypothetical protein
LICCCMVIDEFLGNSKNLIKILKNPKYIIKT